MSHHLLNHSAIPLLVVRAAAPPQIRSGGFSLVVVMPQSGAGSDEFLGLGRSKRDTPTYGGYRMKTRLPLSTPNVTLMGIDRRPGTGGHAS